MKFGENKKSTKSVGMLSMLLAAGVPPELLSGSSRSCTADEAKFLNSLTNNESKRIWRRRIAGGLSESEKKFIQDKLKELE